MDTRMILCCLLVAISFTMIYCDSSEEGEGYGMGGGRRWVRCEDGKSWACNRTRRFEKCCNSGAIIYDSRSNLCCGTSLRSKPTCSSCCCGAGTYDFQTQHCCNGNVKNIADTVLKPSCCGAEVYDRSSQVCCNGTISAKPTGSRRPACCGTVPYNRQTHCCTNACRVEVSTSNQCPRRIWGRPRSRCTQ